MKRFVMAGVAAQVATVTAGHFFEGVLVLSGVLGTAIPFAVGLVYGATEPRSFRESARGGFLIGVAGAFVGVLVAIALGDQTWLLLTSAPLSSGVTGVLGSAIGTAAKGRAQPGAG